MMTATERVMTALRRREPDRVPVHESFWPEFIENWRREKSLPPDADIYEFYNLDVPGYGRVTPDQSPWPSGAKELTRGPGWRIRRTGWREVVRELDSVSIPQTLEPAIQSPADLDRLPPFEPAALDARYAAVPDWIAKLERKNFCFFAKTGGPFSRTFHLRGLQNFLADMALDPPFVAELLRRQTDLLIATTLENLRRAPFPQTAVWIADDCAYRGGPLFSPRLYGQLIQPQLARLCNAIHSTGRLVIFESEGDTRTILDLIIDAGVDVLSNLEPRAGMDVVALKRRYGDRVAFFGTMCNTVILPRGTHAEIRAETLRTLRAGVGGGVVFGSAHAVGSDVSVAAYETFLSTLREHGTYPLHF